MDGIAANREPGGHAPELADAETTVPLLRIATGHTEVGLVEDTETLGHVILTVSDLRRRTSISISMSYLNFDVFAYGMGKVIEDLKREARRT